MHWDGIEYFDPPRAKGVVYTFRGSSKDESNHTFVLKGLRPDASYELRFHDRSSPERSAAGQELLTSATPGFPAGSQQF